MKEQTFEEEHNLFLKFMKKKVFILPGKALYNEKPGLFRVVYTLNEKVHKEGWSTHTFILSSFCFPINT